MDRTQTSDWEPCFSLFGTLTIEGDKVRGPLMKRWADGKWEYRRMTHDEEFDYVSGEMW